MRTPGEHRQRTVAALIGEGVLTFDFACPCEVFGYDRSDIVTPWYRYLVVSQDPPPIRSSTGFMLYPEHGLDALEEADTIVVPGWADDLRPPRPETIAALRDAYNRGARILSVCIGAFVLAEAGLLDGRRATTHWRWADRLSDRYPAVHVDANVLYVDDGQVMTSAGTAAGIDLCLHVVRQDYGAEIANQVARRIVMPPHREGGQAQYIETPIPDAAEDDPIGEVMTWVVEHLADEMTVDDLAARAAMSPRSFMRHFKAKTGTTPLDWILRQRIRLAQRLLETTDLPLEFVAEEAGFGSAITMRHHFAQRVSVSPQQYRRTFREQAAPPV
ncbi:MAG TPA: transcriptional regulator FtrA [Candidatus Limnocylindrales bacterium]|nr:transcriptional regulator FtrA [Candidatus Limnocylindrales bacterium]